MTDNKRPRYARLAQPALGEDQGDLLSWLDDPCADRGLWFREPAGWRLHPYDQLAELTRRTAASLRAAAVEPGDSVVVIHHESPEFVRAFFAAMLLGATPAVLAPPAPFRDARGYGDEIARILKLVRPRAVCTDARTASGIADVVRGAGCALVVTGADARPAYLGESVRPRTGLVQLSSGSTGPRRAVRISMAALEANISAMCSRLGATSADTWASWLPMHHDMGLVASLLTAVAGGCDMRLLSPVDFVRDPMAWLDCFGREGASLTMTPTLGLAQVVRRVRPRDLAGYDFSGWRAVVVAAERIDWSVVTRFVRLLSPHGLRAEAVLAAYGLAEATVGVTCTPPGQGMTRLTVDPASLRPGERVRRNSDGMSVVSCGIPFPGVDVDVVADDGQDAPEDVLGEIQVSGACVASGYVTGDGGDRDFGGRISTGDAGFVHGGELFVIGRLGDAVKVDGRWLFAEDLQQVAAAASPKPGRTVALLGSLDGHDTAVVAVVNGAGDGAAELGHAVLRQVSPVRVLVVATPGEWVTRTTSGKLQRRAIWQRIVTGGDAATVEWDSHARSATREKRGRPPETETARTTERGML